MLPTEVAILLDPSRSQFRGFLIISDHRGPLQVPYVVNFGLTECWSAKKLAKVSRNSTPDAKTPNSNSTEIDSIPLPRWLERQVNEVNGASGVHSLRLGDEKSNVLSRNRHDKVTFQLDPKIKWTAESQTLIWPWVSAVPARSAGSHKGFPKHKSPIWTQFVTVDTRWAHSNNLTTFLAQTLLISQHLHPNRHKGWDRWVPRGHPSWPLFQGFPTYQTNVWKQLFHKKMRSVKYLDF